MANQYFFSIILGDKGKAFLLYGQISAGNLEWGSGCFSGKNFVFVRSCCIFAGAMSYYIIRNGYVYG
jgi:hypothetical protein